MSTPSKRKSAASANDSSSSSSSSLSASSTSSSPSSPPPTPTFLERLSFLVDRHHEWEKTELLDALYWIRQVVALVVGPVFGLMGVEGALGLSLAVGILWVGMFAWYGKFMQVDVEEMGQWELASEGTFPAFALLLLGWIATYSLGKG